MQRICRGLTAISLLLICAAQVQAQPAEVAVRMEGWSMFAPCDESVDAIVLPLQPYTITISARSLNLQSSATLGFVVYSPDGSIDDSFIRSISMLGDWATNNYWNIPTSLLHLDTNSVLPEALLTGGAAFQDAGFQEQEFVDILEITLDVIDTAGYICIDTAFYPPSGDWLMSPDGPPTWHGGGGDLSLGGSRPDAFCFEVKRYWSRCALGGIYGCMPSSYSGSACDTFEIHASDCLGSSYEFTTDGFGVAEIDSQGFATYIPSVQDLGSSVTGIISYDLPDLDICGDSITTRCDEWFDITLTECADCCYVPGDADHNGVVTIGDVTFIIAHIFTGGPAPVCINEADADGNGTLTIGDVTYLIQHIFAGGALPVCGNAGG